ncbi:tyrosine-type recombinase/integrase [Sinorhizobium fredii]|uniref:tyrosine-type recombinase/integrase n=1 Tax=Rhizobium fredii TaxID=380 RepID=UPI0004B2A871|nr:site-specific integrase [Sinorhizobium fredii]
MAKTESKDSKKLTDTIVKDLPTPEKGNKITYDAEVKGFGCRVTAAGARSFILNYRTRSGRERRYTIGAYPDWKTVAAREEAKELKKRIDRGEDPMSEVEADRHAKTVADLCDRYIEEHLPKKRASSQRDDKAMIQRFIKQEGENAVKLEPKLKHLKVSEVTFSDIDGMHRAITKRGSPYQANRVLALLSKMFGLSVRWQWRTDNPCIGVERNQEEKRHRYLSPAELAALTQALAEHKDTQAANIVRMLLLIGARRGEVEAAKWDQFDLTAGVWTKPGSTTKQKTIHRVPLSAPARQLLSELREEAEAKAKKKGEAVSEYVFPGRGGKGHRQEIKKDWRDLCIASGLVDTETVTDAKGNAKVIVTPNARIHDLRHTYASVLASAGLSLPIIGALLGHSQPATTARYSHLMDDPLRQATERVGAVVMPKGEGGKVVSINKG